MLRATDNRWTGLFTNDVKRMMFNEFTGMNLYCDDEDDRVIILCDVTKQAIPCGIMCM